MPAGSVHQVLVCVPKVPNSGNSVGPCSDIGAVRHVPAVMNGFVVEPSLETTLNALQSANNGSIDYVQAGTWFAGAFVLIMTIWLVSMKLGMIISLIKKA